MSTICPANELNGDFVMPESLTNHLQGLLAEGDQNKGHLIQMVRK